MMEMIAERGNYWIIVALMMTGLYITFAAQNLIKRLVGLSVFQTSVFLFYISLSKVAGGTAPILFGDDIGYHGDYGGDGAETSAYGSEVSGYGADAVRGGDVYDAAHHGLANVYSNPLPHVLILTAIVVGVATLSVGLALIVRIREAYGTIEADEVRDIDIDVALAEEAEVAEAGATA